MRGWLVIGGIYVAMIVTVFVCAYIESREQS